MKPSDLPKHVRAQLDKPAVAGSAWFRLDGDPPTTTHHDKTIGTRVSKGGRRHATLRDTPELERARNWFIERIPFSDTAIAGPIAFLATWYFKAPRPELAGSPMQLKPDLDNIEKVALDVLALRGWIKQDQQVFHHNTAKYYAPADARPGVDLTIVTAEKMNVVNRKQWPYPAGKLLPLFNWRSS